MTTSHFKARAALAIAVASTALAALPAWASAGPGTGPITAGPTPDTQVRVQGGIEGPSGSLSSYEQSALSQEGRGVAHGQLSSDGSTVQALAESGASIPDGTLQALAAALPGGRSTADATLRQRMTVSGEGPGQAVLTVRLDGTFLAGASGILDANNAALVTVSYRTATSMGGIELNITPHYVNGGTCPAAFMTGHVAHCLGGTQIGATFDIPFDLPAPGQWLSIGGSLRLQSLDGATVDFGQGLQLSLKTPEGILLSSPVGVSFPVSAVPEPSTAALGLLGLLALAHRLRRQRG